MYIDEEKNGSPIYTSENFKKFVDSNAISEEEYTKMSGNTVEESKQKGNQGASNNSANGAAIHVQTGV